MVRLNRPQRLRPTGQKDGILKKETKMAKFAPIEFFKQVRAEAKRVTWPTRPETISSTIAVFIMVVIASIFLFLADQLLSWIVRLVLGLGS